MCDFCNEIFDTKKLSFAWWGNRKKRTSEELKAADAEYDRWKKWLCKRNETYYTYIGQIDGSYSIHAEADENEGVVEDIKYCPYCGRKLVTDEKA